ncbi:MAG: hypothetical protein RJA22_2950 [Verrucomicrobiota bacterium]
MAEGPWHAGRVTSPCLWLCLVLAGAAQTSAVLAGDLRPGRPYTHHAVLQREQPCPVFGTDRPGTRVTVEFAGQTLSATAGADGTWRVVLGPLPATATPRSLVLRGSGEVTLTNVVVGDVWLVAGQSNADFPLASAAGGRAAAAAATNPLVRCLHLAEAVQTTAVAWKPAQVARLNAREFFTGSWQPSTPAAAAAVSALGWFFAREMQVTQGVPVGLIDCTVGGTPIESWIPEAALAAHPRLRAVTEDFLGSPRVAMFAKERLRRNLADWDRAGRAAPMPDHPYKPGVCWRFGLAGVAPFAMRGVLWYQGETNADFPDPAEYALMARWHTEAFTLLVTSWRAAWGRDTLPFYFVQLPRLNRPSWPWFRESQWECARTIPGTAMAVAWEYGEPGNVHPVQKEPVARRLARLARALSHGEPIEWSGPLPRGHRVEGGSMVVEFEHAGGGLASSDGQPLRLFEVAGADRRFHAATAVVEGSAVRVSSPQVPEPVAVRHAWVPDGRLNLVNRAGLPATPFRTDAW